MCHVANPSFIQAFICGCFQSNHYFIIVDFIEASENWKKFPGPLPCSLCSQNKFLPQHARFACRNFSGATLNQSKDTSKKTFLEPCWMLYIYIDTIATIESNLVVSMIIYIISITNLTSFVFQRNLFSGTEKYILLLSYTTIYRRLNQRFIFNSVLFHRRIL